MSRLVSGDRRLRVAVEGCGHGTLHAIYASVEESCRAKGWETVDLLIIGGDFQSVRNAYDLNVTAMPEKYRRMADFHEYYSGARVAPYLTIFIGGNHEASNYLFELYYGGWVAPNIYYMGAANILRLGPLRIAGLSGIWKGYDYRKPHFERLPYNRSEYHSIFHVRELDVRKLLSVRSQVDIGLSHDWPKGVEWRGQHHWLFQRKKGFEADAISGKLGSVAAGLCLERLRPMYWFSAHLHVKYPALIQHEQLGEIGTKPSKWQSRNQDLREDFSETASTLVNSGKNGISHNTSRQNPAVSPQMDGHRTRIQDRAKVSAWQNFHVSAQQDDIRERDRIVREQQEREAEEARTGIRSQPQYTFEETFKQIRTEGLARSITAVVTSSTELGESNEVPGLDGCGESTLKRRRGTSSPDVTESQPDQYAEAIGDYQRFANVTTLDGTTASSSAVLSAQENNPDAVEIDLDDTDSEAGDKTVVQALKPDSPAAQEMTSSYSNAAQVSTAGAIAGTPTGAHDRQTPTSIVSEDGEDGGVGLNPLAQSFRPVPSISYIMERKKSENLNPFAQPFADTASVIERKKGDEMNAVAKSFASMGSVASLAEPQNDNMSCNEMMVAEGHDMSLPNVEARMISNKADDRGDVGGAPIIDNDVSEEMRAQLAALSGSFAPQVITKSESLPFPEAVTNKTTKFLALDKCEREREFLQLLEVEAISDPTLQKSPTRPFKLQYDPEWLAILRVFAPDLELSGNPTKTMTPDRGETYYRDRIAEEAAWVSENIVRKDLLDIPENFMITAPIYDPSLRVDSSEMPREYTNPQTSEFCKLIGVENPFDISEEERDVRMAKGPRPDTEHQNFRGGRHDGGGRGGGQGRFTTNRGGGHGSRGGRGRGRGRW